MIKCFVQQFSTNIWVIFQIKLKFFTSCNEPEVAKKLQIPGNVYQDSSSDTWHDVGKRPVRPILDLKNI